VGAAGDLGDGVGAAASRIECLFDLNARYTDVVPLDETVQYMRTVGHNSNA
jgi:hypothetical protein